MVNYTQLNKNTLPILLLLHGKDRVVESIHCWFQSFLMVFMYFPLNSIERVDYGQYITVCCAYTTFTQAHKADSPHRLYFSHTLPWGFLQPHRTSWWLTSAHWGSLDSDRSKHRWSAITASDSGRCVPWDRALRASHKPWKRLGLTPSQSNYHFSSGGYFTEALSCPWLLTGTSGSILVKPS